MFKRHKDKSSKQQLTLMVLLVTIIISVVGPFIEIVNAELNIASVDSYTEVLKRRSVAQAMKECVASGAFQNISATGYSTITGITFRDLSSGKWDDRYLVKPWVSPVVDGSDSVYDCNEVVQSAKEIFFEPHNSNISFKEMFCLLGGSSSKLELVGGVTTNVDSGQCMDAKEDNYGYISRDKAGSVYDLLKARNHFPNRDITLDYSLAFASFTAGVSGCNATFSENPGADSYPIDMRVANFSGTTTDVKAVVPDKNKRIKLFAKDFGSTTFLGITGGSLTCAELASRISNLAPAAAVSFKTGEGNPLVGQTIDEIANALGVDRSKVAACSAEIANLVNAGGGQDVVDEKALIDCLTRTTGIVEFEIRGMLANIQITKPETPTEAGEGESTCSLDGIGWIVCPMMNFMADMLDAGFGFISDQFLAIETKLTEGDVVGVWEKFRNIANTLFVVMFLIVVFSQVSGYGLDNYGIKKLLPKLIIVAILVNVSLFICQVLIDLSNILGYTIKDFLEVSIPVSVTDSHGNAHLADAGNVVGAVLAGGAAALSIKYLLLPVIGTALAAGLVAVVSTVIILIIRKALVVLLVVVSPLAFVALLLPNTEKLFNKWKDLMVAMLVLFPAIGLIYGASVLSAKVIMAAAGSGNDTRELMQVTGLVIMTVPLFATIPVVRSSLNAVGKFGATMDKISGRIREGAARRGENSRLAKYGKFQQQERDRKRALAQAGAYRGRNPLRRGVSWTNQQLNKLPGKFGTRNAAAGVSMVADEENKEVEAAVLLMNSGVAPEDKVSNAASKLSEAAASGDVVKARAATKILTNSGASGRDKLRNTLSQVEQTGGFRGDVKNSIKTDINAAGLKGSDNILATWSYSNNTLEDIKNDPNTIGKLTPEEVVGQSEEILTDSQAHITTFQKRAVRNNPELMAKVGANKRQFF